MSTARGAFAGSCTAHLTSRPSDAPLGGCTSTSSDATAPVVTRTSSSQRHGGNRMHGTPQTRLRQPSIANGIADVQAERLRNGFIAHEPERQPDIVK
jgi:hypothetical protein